MYMHNNYDSCINWTARSTPAYIDGPVEMAVFGWCLACAAGAAPDSDRSREDVSLARALPLLWLLRADHTGRATRRRPEPETRRQPPPHTAARRGKVRVLTPQHSETSTHECGHCGGPSPAGLRIQQTAISGSLADRIGWLTIHTARVPLHSDYDFIHTNFSGIA